MPTVEDWAKPTPVSENRSGLIGKPISRYEGPLKVSGVAAYAAEVRPPSPPLYGVMVTAPIARGRIAAIDLTRARAAPGVALVWTYQDAPAQTPPADPPEPMGLNPVPALYSDRVGYFGQPTALVVADSFENANAAAALVDLTYEADWHATDLAGHSLSGRTMAPDKAVGAFETAFAAAPVKLDDYWRTAAQNHCQMEPHATLAWWENGVCTAHASIQLVARSQSIVSKTLNLPKESIRLVSRYVGGGFGGKAQVYEDLILAMLASRELDRPVKIVMSRQQMFHTTIHRPATVQRVRLGATRDGRLTALAMMSETHNNRGSLFMEPAANVARNLYAAAHRLTGNRLVLLDLPPAGPMRAPGEAPGSLSIECAMDELAEKLGIDPVELRIRNEPGTDPETGKPFSMRQLARCLREGAVRFGWDRRDPRPGQVRDGRWQVGYGVAAAIRGAFLMDAEADVSVDTAGVVTLRQGMTDIGTGSYTVLAQLVGETLGVPYEQVRVELGDSDMAPAFGSGGQTGAASAGSAAFMAGMNLRRALADLASADPDSPLFGGPAEQATFLNGVIAIGNRSETLASLVSRAAPDGVTAHGVNERASDGGGWSQHTYGAHFAEVGVDTVTGEVRLRRMLGVFSAGRILNAKLARSQLTGGMIWSVSAALFEGNAVDTVHGSFINQDLGSYLVPTHADIGDVDAIMLDEVDDKASAIGIKGVGELGACGAGAAVANALYNACGARLRDYPITPDKVVAEMERLERNPLARGVGRFDDWARRRIGARRDGF